MGFGLPTPGGWPRAKSISGNVEITDTEIEGQLEASSVSGNVVLRNVKARSLEAGAVSGNLLVQDVTCERVEAQTVSGDVQFSGALIRGGRYELSSHSGGVQVAVGGDTGFEVEATSFSGNVRSDIALKHAGKRRPATPTVDPRRLRRRQRHPGSHHVLR